jgi:hypothetical protein
VSTNAKATDNTQMMGAGYIEGYLTASRIAQQYANTNAWVLSQFSNKSLPPEFPIWYSQQDAWARKNIQTNTSSPIWQAAGLVYSQFDGLMAGYGAAAPSLGLPALTEYDFQQLNSMGDILDLIPAIMGLEHGVDWDSLTDEELMEKFYARTHCSALVKVNGDLTEMWFGHGV